MSIQKVRVPINTDGTGADVTTIRASGVIVRAIQVDIGTLSTPDITITEEPVGTEILAVAGLAADARYLPTVEGSDDAGAAVTGSALPVVCLDRIMVTTAGGGASKVGEVTFLLER